MDIMRQTALQLQQIVERAQEHLVALTEAESQSRQAAMKWSRKEVLGHLIDSASNNHQRFVRAQLLGELVFPGYAQEDWNRVQQYQSETWENLVRLWTSYNLHLAHIIAAIPESAAENRCTIGDHEPVMLQFLVTDYVKHLEHHLAQIG
jgi:DinB superfamily